MKKVAVIGLGNIGLRHLQGVLNFSSEYEIYGVDNNIKRLTELKKEYSNCIFMESIEALPKVIDVVIIATTSSVRRRILDDIFKSEISISYMILEKILFQNEEDYYWTQEQLRKRDIKAWVNCVRRETNGYKKVKEELDKVNSFVFKVYGSNWGLCCNGIHFLDVIKYLTNDAEIEFSGDGLSLPIVDSKRIGFKECFGSIRGKGGICSDFSIECDNKDYASCVVYIECEKFSLLIDEDKKRACIKDYNKASGFELTDFEFPYVSELSGKIVKNILDKGVCDLPDFENSMEVHLQFLKMLNKFFKDNGLEVKECPIT